MNNSLRPLVLALALAGSACATAKVEPPVQVSDDPDIQALQIALDRALAGRPALQRRLNVFIEGVEQKPDVLVFNLSVERLGAFGRPAQTFALATGCAPNDVDDCVRKAMDALEAAAEP